MGQLCGGFHPFGQHLHVQLVGHGDDGFNQHRRAFATGGGGGLGINVHHKRAVDFQRINRQVLEVGQAGVARAKVVQGKAHAVLAQQLHFCQCGFQVVGHHAFGQLQLQGQGVQAQLLQGGAHVIDKIGLSELAGADVYRHGQRLRPGGMARFGLPAAQGGGRL